MLFVGFFVLWVSLPITLPVALVIDSGRWLVARTPFMAWRLLTFGVAYATLEIIGVIALATVWTLSGFGAAERRLASLTFAIQVRWAEAVLTAVRSIFGLRISVDGEDHVVDTPYVLLARHTSIVDNLLPSHFISRPYGIHVSYVMKAELLADPCLDVAGNRLPNVFVKRTSGDTDGEVTAIRSLGRSIEAGSAILIYPEGTRFTPTKLKGAVQRLANRNPELHRIASGYRSVLPPRPAGTLALLESTAADVVVLVHRGFDGFARIADIWRGAMVDRVVEVDFWRIPHSSIPTGRAERVEWLYRLWSDVDAWVMDGIRPGAHA